MKKNLKNSKKNTKDLPVSIFRTRKTITGFSIIEVLISITIILAIGTVSVSSFLNWRSAKRIETSADTVLSALKEARNLTVNGKGAYSYGVYFGNLPQIFIFKGAIFDPTLIVSTAYLPSGTTVSTSTFGDVVYFQKFSGNANGNGIIIVKDISNASNTRTINIDASGGLSTK